MPPKKKETAASSPPVRRSSRTASKAAAATSEALVATSSPAKSSTKESTSATKASAKTTASTDMGSAVSAVKKGKSKKATKTAKNGDGSSKIEDLTVDDSTAVAGGNGKRKTGHVNTPAQEEIIVTTTKKAKLSKSDITEGETSKPTAASKSSKPSASKSQPKTVDAWYAVYASSDDPEQIDFDGIVKLLEDLDIKLDGASIYILCWKLECEAMGVIPKQKWISGMNKHGIKNNAQLLKSLATWLKETKPTTPASESFLKFYKFMFNFFKATPETRSVAADSAIAALTFLLDPLAYDLQYDPEISTPLSPEAHPYPHTAPFLKFLMEKQPVKVINRDQWDSFVPFNKSVNYALDNYNPEGAWPNLYDQYVEWRKETEGLDIGPKDGPDTET